MKVQFASDLHLEFPQNRAYLDAHPLKKKADILILAGDTNYLDDMIEKDIFFQKDLKEFEHVYLVPGNHEFYKQSFDIAQALRFEKKISGNCTYLNNKTIVLGDVRIIFTTLWSEINRSNYFMVPEWMNDFPQSIFEGREFTVEDFNDCHQVCKNFLISELKKSFSGKTVVVSHHVPYFPSRFQFEEKKHVYQAYYVDLVQVASEGNVSHWIHGHNHDNRDSFRIGETSFHTNQLGYVFQSQHFTFSLEKSITV